MLGKTILLLATAAAAAAAETGLRAHDLSTPPGSLAVPRSDRQSRRRRKGTTSYPTSYPTTSPTTTSPTTSPTLGPTPGPTGNPTPGPTSNPTPGPTSNPTPGPTSNPTPGPTSNPTPGPTTSPTMCPASVAAEAYEDALQAINATGCYTSTGAAKDAMKTLKSKFAVYKREVRKELEVRKQSGEAVCNSASEFKKKRVTFAAAKRGLRLLKRKSMLNGKNCSSAGAK